MAVSGKWEGKLLDVSGPMARVAAVLKESKGNVTGEFSVYLGSARDCCTTSAWKLAQTAPVSGSYTGENLRLKYELDIGAKPIGVVFEAKLTKADPHAQRALVGSYTVSDEGKQIGFEGGVCVLWLYRK